MMQRLQEAEETIAQLRAQNNDSSREDNHNHPSPAHQTQVEPSNTIGTHDISPTGNVSIQDSIPFRTSPSLNMTTSTQINYSNASKGTAPPDLSVDGNGEIQYYGPTSAVHDPPQPHLEPPIVHISVSPSAHSSISEVSSALLAHAQESKIWEDYALGNASLQTGIPRPIIAKLLHMNRIWISPMFLYVYRPAFIRDMATNGRYYSEFLLTVICAHAAKYQDGNYAEFLLARVRRLLGTAIQQPSSIPTVQALLQLSARDLANGSMSQAWVYSGIAFRMANDLGLEYIGPNIKGLGPVDLEIRKRLYWSCYFWDK